MPHHHRSHCDHHSALGHHRRPRGFTLIEMMITVAIIGILAAIAYPSYTEHVAKGRRSEVKGTLLEASQWMERFYSENYRYDRNTAGTAITNTALFGGAFTQSPRTGTAAYTLAINAPSTGANAGRSYTITATRTGAASNDRCGDFVIDQSGNRRVINFNASFANAAAAAAACW